MNLVFLPRGSFQLIFQPRGRCSRGAGSTNNLATCPRTATIRTRQRQSFDLAQHLANDRNGIRKMKSISSSLYYNERLPPSLILYHITKSFVQGIFSTNRTHHPIHHSSLNKSSTKNFDPLTLSLSILNLETWHEHRSNYPQY